MERLTIPDIPIEGGTRRAVIDARAVRQEAMKIYWRLKKYEDTGLSPEEIEKMKKKQIPMEVTDVHVDEYYCPACGSENNCGSGPGLIGDRFCPVCGQALSQNRKSY